VKLCRINRGGPVFLRHSVVVRIMLTFHLRKGSG